MKVKLFANMLREIIQYGCIEIHNPDSVWDLNVIKETVLPEMRELFIYAKKGEILFKNNDLNGCLDSFNVMITSNKGLEKTILGLKIDALQKMYRTFPVMYLNKRSG